MAWHGIERHFVTALGTAQPGLALLGMAWYGVYGVA
jgi:hypothetical protein